MAKAPIKTELTRAQQVTMGQSPKKETTDGKEANPEPTGTVEPSDPAAQADGDGDAD
jgi:hypothetical protein